MNILHISDIHFGRERSGLSDSFEKRELILYNLISTVSSLDSPMKPDIVVVTGDIAWRGKESEFLDAYNWFQQLKSALGLDEDRFIFCPGNHDLNRNVGIDFDEETLLFEDKQKGLNIERCDFLYEYEQAHLLEPRFYDYNLFCEKMGMQPYSYQLTDGTTEYSYLIGASSFQFGKDNYQIVCFNTAYLPYGRALRDDQMFLGLPQIKNIINHGILEKRPNCFRIALFHHADRFLHSGEQCAYNQREAPLPLLMKNVDLALCGHTETGSTPEFRHYQGGGRVLSGGATYYNDLHHNSFSIVSVRPGKKPSRYSFVCNGEQWVPFEKQEKTQIFSNHHELIWKDSIHARKKYGIATTIDGKMKVFYYGYVEAFDTLENGVLKTYISNRFNPARPLDFSYSITHLSEKLGINGYSRMRHGPSIHNTILARKAMCDYNSFLAQNIKNAKNAVWGVVDMEDSLKYLYSDPIDISRTTHYSENYISLMDFYEKLSQIESKYDVRFYIPDREFTEAEQLAIDILEGIRENNNASYEITNALEGAVNLSTKEELKWINNIAESGEAFTLRFKVKVLLQLFGTTIDLGNCFFFYPNIHVYDKKETFRKLSTWEIGDRRSIRIEFENNIMECCIIPVSLFQHDMKLPFDLKNVMVIPDDIPPFFSDVEKDIIVHSDTR